MQAMFYKALSFNQPLNKWDTSLVITMYRMFNQTDFNQDISMWNVDKVRFYSDFASPKLSPANKPKFK